VRRLTHLSGILQRLPCSSSLRHCCTAWAVRRGTSQEFTKSEQTLLPRRHQTLVWLRTRVEFVFANDSAFDRLTFLLWQLDEVGLLIAAPEKTSPHGLILPSSPFSPVRFIKQKSRKVPRINEFLRNQGPEFCAVQTAWRRGRDSLYAISSNSW
jgi:hypothetical protein